MSSWTHGRVAWRLWLSIINKKYEIRRNKSNKKQIIEQYNKIKDLAAHLMQLRRVLAMRSNGAAERKEQEEWHAEQEADGDVGVPAAEGDVGVPAAEGEDSMDSCDEEDDAEAEEGQCSPTPGAAYHGKRKATWVTWSKQLGSKQLKIIGDVGVPAADGAVGVPAAEGDVGVPATEDDFEF